MSRLDSFIRRLEAQRACLGEAVRHTQELNGVVLELGLGNGRTFDHLRELCPKREIYVFDRQVAAHPACIPSPDHLFLGEFVITLKRAIEQLGSSCAAIVHIDLGNGNAAESQALAAQLAPDITTLMSLGAVIVSDQLLISTGLKTLPLPSNVRPGRYFMAQKYA